MSGTMREITMGRKQKNAFFDDDLCRLMDAYQSITGVSFSRFINAAVIEFFFTRSKMPDPVFLQIAVALEKGKWVDGSDFGVEDIPARIHGGQIGALRMLAKDELDRAENDAMRATAFAKTDKAQQLQHQIDQFDRIMKYMTSNLGEEAADPIAGIIDYWSSTGLHPTKVLYDDAIEDESTDKT